MINILIRTHKGREQLFERALKSVTDQTYKDINVIVYEDPGNNVYPFHYNEHCNLLKGSVNDGFFFFLDSDDRLIDSEVLERLAPLLDEDKANIVQMLRKGRPKPFQKMIKRGFIGMPCMILHSKYKNIADVTPKAEGDYEWIKAVTDQIGYNWIEMVVVDAGKRGFGK